MNRPLIGALLIGSLALAARGGGDDDKAASPTTTGTGLDTTFGTNGVAKIALSADSKDRLSAVALGTDGKLYIVIFGTTTAGPDRADNDFALVGLTSAGALDPTFGTAGVTKVDLDQSRDSARNVKVVDNQILATGYTRGADDVVQPVLIRTSIDGKPDTTFGTGGVASHQVLAAVAESYGFDVQGDDYVLTGYGKDAEADKVDLIAYRFTATGELDRTFGTNGVTRIDNAGEDDRGRNLVVLSDGRILYAGSGKIDKDNVQAMVVLLSKDGAPDTGFGTDGRILTDLGTNGDSWYGVALSPDGTTAYLAGYSNVSADDVKSDDSFLGRLKIS